MNKGKESSGIIAILIWALTNIVFAFGFCICTEKGSLIYDLQSILFIWIFSSLFSFPIVILLFIVLPLINRWNLSILNKYYCLIAFCFLCTSSYGLIFSNFFYKQSQDNFQNLIYSTFALFVPSLLAIAFTHKKINKYFLTTKIDRFMEHNQFQDAEKYGSTQNSETAFHTSNANQATQKRGTSSNKTLFKGLITATLILVMMIPTTFVRELVKERETRQEEVVSEVANGWSGPQTISGPFIFIPYQITTQDTNKKNIIITKQLFLLPENLNVDGNIVPEIRLRSIYKVLLYRSDINTSGNFRITLPKDVDINSLQLSEAKICYGISDFKGIEEKLSINFNGSKYDFTPGFPTKIYETKISKARDVDANNSDVNATKQVESIGLSANIDLKKEDLSRPINFDMHLKIKGIEGLHFMPLSGNSKFNIKSTWADPKFDGNSLPNYREVNKDGFQAKWSFNSANLPFGTVLKEFNLDKQELAFGINMIQTTDQYSKTMRSIKYAILFIGLTFVLFFIIELTQQKPMHPIQYALIGMALVIFFTLLLSISEFLSFDWAYLIASFSTISLITLYAKGHFKSFKSASIFGSLLTCLYTFIYILIQLEDAALLVGSIGLFIILAMVMFGSRKINWYGENTIG